jgi:hypothetical protein
MLSKQTVLVLGAGASFEIDMCLGETLMKEIGHQVNMQFEAGHRKGGSDVIYEALRKLAIQSKQDINVLHAAGRQIARGISTAGSIDNYIHHHRNDAAIKAVGKIAIVNAILQYERKSKVFIDETKHPKVFRDVDGLEKTWLHSFFRLLGEGIVVAETLEGIFDNVSVINFNYDRCFEQYLWLSLQNRFSIGDEAATALMKKLRIHHPYGTVARLPWDDRNGVSLGADP